MFSVRVLSKPKIKKPNLLMRIFKKKNKNRLIHNDVSDYLFSFVLLNIQNIVVVPNHLCTLFPIEESTRPFPRMIFGGHYYAARAMRVDLLVYPQTFD